MSSDDVAISIRGLGKAYTLRHRAEKHTTAAEAVLDRMRHPFRRDEREIFWALRDVELDIGRGEVLGLIGRNGAGKSTLLKLLSRITSPSEGEIRLHGRVGSLLEVGTGFHPELTGRENVYLNGAVLGMRRREIDQRFEEIVDFAGVERFLDMPVKRYSSGMYVRLAFAVAAHMDSEILLVDEVLAVGDSEFQKRCLGRMESLAAAGRTVVFVSHSTATVARLCESVVLLADGEVRDRGPTGEVIARYNADDGAPETARTWTPRLAPGDDAMRLRALEVHQCGKIASAEVDIRHPLEITATYDLAPGVRQMPLVSLVFLDVDGAVRFGTNSHHAVKGKAGSEGRFVASCEIPGNFLTEGRHLINVMLHTGSLVHASVDAALSFDVVDPCMGDSVRGDFVGDWSGAVRPMLPWRVASSG